MAPFGVNLYPDGSGYVIVAEEKVMIARALRVVLSAGWRAGLALFAFSQIMLTVNGMRQSVDWPHLDFYTFYRAALKVRAGEPLYTFDHIIITEQFSNNIVTLQHPLVAVLFVPLSFLPQHTAYWLWATLSMLAWGSAVVISLRMTALQPKHWVIPILLASCTPGLQWDLIWGQLACIIALGLVLGLTLIRRERWIAAGWIVGMLIMCKFLLAPLALPLLLRGRGRALGGLIGGAALTVVLALPRVGWHAFPEWLTTLRDVSWAGSSGNLSFHAYATRATGGPLSPTLTAALSLLTVALGVALLIRQVAGMPNTPRLYCGLIAISLLGSPLGWGNYTLFLLPLWALLLTTPLSNGRRVLVIAATACLWYADFGLLLPGGWFDILHTLGIILFILSVSAAPSIRFAPIRRHARNTQRASSL